TELLRSALTVLRSQKVRLLSLRELLVAVHAGEPIEGFVFTVDDGYDDFETRGAPVFQEFDCPVTVFVATGFLDRAYWHWWDKADWVFYMDREVPRPPLDDEGEPITVHDVQRLIACTQFTRAVKSLAEHERHEVVCRLARAAG